jgi:hypothetical protein
MVIEQLVFAWFAKHVMNHFVGLQKMQAKRGMS